MTAKGYDGDVHPQRHRHRRQDHRPKTPPRAGPVRDGRSPTKRACFNDGYDVLGLPAADRTSRGASPGTSRDRRRDDARTGRERSRLRGGGQRLLRRGEPAPATSRSPTRSWRTSSSQAATADRQARPARLRDVEGGQARRADAGDPVGRGRPGWHPGCVGDGPQVPRCGLRHPRRRYRPDLPAPRERDRPVQGLPATTSPDSGCTTPGSPWPARR